MSNRIAVLGDGAWGTAIALVLAARPEHQVLLWSAREENARVLRERRENVHYLPGVPIPESVELTADIQRAAEASDLWVSAIPTVYLRRTLEPLASALRAETPMLSLSKGVEAATLLRPTQILEQVLGPRRLATLSGPSHAEEVSRGLPTTVVVASADVAFARWLQDCFSTERFRVYTNSDLPGVELGGALKNVIAIAAGIADGLGYGDNTKAALLTRGLAEMTRFGAALGARPQTFFGLAGIGDLITTCISRHGRNRHVGERLGRGEKLAD
ncbi:MAG: NAD(P)-dependent glycerol-3-phosphate dehydrogenase, partial [Planctomycetia bacterium]|nr:NAD(P)-dependent glycerol-3-phosphate dehydrogenase [Planctomycetia bacterium]